MIKAIFFDVDGTLVDPATHRIPQNTLDTLQALRDKGIRLFVSTGRHSSFMGPVTAQFDFDGYITVSGQFCRCGDRVVHRNPIPEQGIREICSAMAEHGFSGMFLEGEECWLNDCDQAAEAFLEEFQVARPPVFPLSRALEREVYQVIVMLPPEREGLLLERAKHLAHTRWHPGFLDAMPPGGGKAAGIAAVLDWAGLRPEQAMAFGDGENDLSMFSCVGIGVAMGNANDAVKAGADWVTAPVDEDGITAAARHFGLL